MEEAYEAASLWRADHWEVVHAIEILDEKKVLAHEALATALGLVFDATTDMAEVFPGGALPVTVRVLNASEAGVPLAMTSVRLQSSAGWLASPLLVAPGATEVGDETVSDRFVSDRFVSDKFVLTEGLLGAVGRSQRIADSYRDPALSAPQSRIGALYDHSGVPPATLGEPLAPPPLMADFFDRAGGDPSDTVGDLAASGFSSTRSCYR